MKAVAIIPARGGSKRLPRKNIKNFLGKPIIAYTIEAALQSEIFDEVIVSTEDEEIGKVSETYGATVDWRPAALAGDKVTVNSVCLEYLDRKEAKNINIDVLVVLYATAPMRNSDDIKRVVNLLSEDCQFAMGATVCDDGHQLLHYKDGNVDAIFPHLIELRPIQCEQYCLGNGSTYAVNVDAFKKQKTFYGEKLKVYLMPKERSVDIDTQSDFDLAAFHAEKGSL